MWTVIGDLLRRTGVRLTIPFAWTGYRKPVCMKDLIGLFDAICDSYDRLDFQPQADGETFCNEAVNAVAVLMGCHDFTNKTADEIMTFLAQSPNWSEIPVEKAQDMANTGSLLVAGLDSSALSQTHGHVVVIRPGKPCYSGKWGLTPRCLNVGSQNFIARAKKGALTNQPCGINESFIPLPLVYVWRSSL